MQAPTSSAAAVLPLDPTGEADLERRFGGLSRLYGVPAYHRIRAARVVVVGVGGVGSWAAEALARSGVAELTLIDLDHVAESNINRQVQALSSTVGQAKVLALRDRIAQIHPGCGLHLIEEFVEPGNWPAILPAPVDAVIDCCDQVRAKLAMAAWAMTQRVPLVCVGAAGGKRRAHLVDVADLSETTHDPLLASLRQRLRKEHGAARQGRIGVTCVYSKEPITRPAGVASCDVDANLNCHGYGSAVSVTASFGMVAAGEVLHQLAISG